MRSAAPIAVLRASLCAGLCLAYLLAAALPCPPPAGVASVGAAHPAPDAALAPAHAHGDHAAHGGGAVSHPAAHPGAPDHASHVTTSLDAPCPCGCDEPGPGAGPVKRLGSILLPEPPLDLASIPSARPAEAVPLRPDRPLRIDPPIPISA